MAGRKKSSTHKRRRIAESFQLYEYQHDWVDDERRYKLACKARQIGFTFAATLRAVLKRLEEPGLTVWLSASERQALEALEQVERHVRALGATAEFYSEFIAGSSTQQHRVCFPNRSRIIALPANPDTVRGFSGDVILDEFAFHRDAYAIWRAAFATATRGFQLEVISTPNGTQGKFYELARQAGLLGRDENRAAKTETWPDDFRSSNFPPAADAPRAHAFRSPTQSVWSTHWCDIYAAHAHGFDVDIPSLRAAVDDEDTWSQEYCCQFLSDAASYLPLELVVAAESSPVPPLASAATPAPLGERELGTENRESGGSRFPIPVSRACYLGVDIGRQRDKTVLWLLEAEEVTPTASGQLLRTRLVQQLERAPFATQRAAIESLLMLRASDSPFAIARCAIDATGLGAMLAEELAARFGARVEPVSFTLAVKEDLAVRLKRRLEERRLHIPYDPAIRRALNAVKRYTTPAGHFRFDAARSDEGHADEFWALALACYAADARPLSTEFIPTQLASSFRQAHAF